MMMMRAVFGIWLSAILLTTVPAWLALAAVPGLHVQRLAAKDARIVVIGTSLVGFAIPPEGQGLLGEGRDHIRLAAGGMSEDLTLDLCEAALALERTETIVIEAHPFVRDFKDDRRPSRVHGVLGPGAAQIIQTARDLRPAVKLSLWRAGLRSDPFASLTAEYQVDNADGIRPHTLQRIYPLSIRPPRLEERLDALVAKAKARRVGIILVAPPRSATAARYNGPEVMQRLDQALVALAARLDVPLFAPSGPWPDGLFVDHAHMNRAGRDRFMTELRRFAVAAHAG